MRQATVALVATPETGHFPRLCALIAGVAAAGGRAVLLGDRRFRGAVERAGGAFHDLYGRHPIEAVDDASHPPSLRHVTYAAWRVEEVAAELRAVGPDVVVHDAFSVVSPLAARRLDLPTVCVCAGHNLRPEEFRERLLRDVRVRVSPRCEEAVARLREVHGLADASPFSYMSARSPHLNLYGEPEEFVDPDVREALEPVAFFGSLGPRPRDGAGPSPFGSEGDGGTRVLVSFGTVVWRHFAREADDALGALTRALARREDVRAVVSLGGAERAVPAAGSGAVRFVPYLDQARALREAHLFVTHHGLSSTHEAVWHGVPMLSYPFFWDQPALAARCARLGLAIPLAAAPRAPLPVEEVERALAEAKARRGAMLECLREVRAWEERVDAGRPEVVRRILDLARDVRPRRAP